MGKERMGGGSIGRERMKEKAGVTNGSADCFVQWPR